MRIKISQCETPALAAPVTSTSSLGAGNAHVAGTAEMAARHVVAGLRRQPSMLSVIEWSNVNPALAVTMSIARARTSRLRTSSPLFLEKDVQFYEVTLQPGAAHCTGTREFLTVEKGRIRVTSGKDCEDLEEREGYI